MWTIRPATGADSPAVVEVVRSVFAEYGFTWAESEYTADLYDVQAHYLDRGHRFWVAELAGRVSGCVGLELFAPIPPGDGSVVHEGRVRIAGADCSLERLYTVPSARGIGLGRALFEQAVYEARVLGRRRMEIWSDKLLLDAHRLYRKFGAEVVAERLCDDPDESPEWGMKLDLGNARVVGGV